MKLNYKIVTVTLIISVLAYSSMAQNVVSDTVDLMSLELEQLMNIKIVSASKKSEDLFDAPLSASVLTKDEIRKAGCTSIMEAFKLMPGVIVREQTNGNYDIHVRGLDGVPYNNVFTNLTNNTTLVMIDNRPVYNYYQGGTFWETLTIDINDVERIEIIRGPAAAMYGPNAATGVINIITRVPDIKGLYAVANSQVGTNNTSIGNASVGYKFNNKISLVASGNFQQRDRHDDQNKYYSLQYNDYVPVDSLLTQTGPFALPLQNVNGRFPHTSRSMERYGANAFVNYKPKDDISIKFAAGLEESEVQKVFGINGTTPLSTSRSDTRYIDLQLTAKGLIGRASFGGGTQAPALGFINQKYDFNTFDGTLEYDFVYKNLSIKPGISYWQAEYDDSKYVDEAMLEGVFNGSKSLYNRAAFVRGDYKLLNEKLRLIAGLRVDEFNNPGDAYLSHQFAINYTLSSKHILRITESRAYRSPFMTDTYLDLQTGLTPQGPNTFSQRLIQGNRDLKLVTVDMIELGYRGKLSDKFYLDIEVFNMRAKNFAYTVEDDTTQRSAGGVTIIAIPLKLYNIPSVANQTGVTVSVNCVIRNFQIKPYLTWQQTKVKKYSDYRNYPDAQPGPLNNFDPANNNIYTYSTVVHTATPAIFGGAFINYTVNAKLNVNLNPYYLAKQKFIVADNLNVKDGIRGIDNVPAKFTMNAKVSYNIIKPLALFVTARNLFNNNTREFYKSDNIGSSYLVGLNFQL